MPTTRTYCVGDDGNCRRLDALTGPWTNLTITIGSTPVGVDLLDVETDPTNGDKVIVVGRGLASNNHYGIYVSSDAGVTWTQPTGNYTTNPDGTDFVWYEVFYLDTNNIFVAGPNGYMVKSTDGGLTFNKTTQVPAVPPCTPPGPTVINTLYSVHFIDPLTGVVGLEDGAIAKTTNGGTSWTVYSQIKDTVTGICGIRIRGIHMSANAQIINALSELAIFRSTNGGSTWTLKKQLSIRAGEHLTWTSDSNLWAFTIPNEILRSNDAGNSWTSIRPYVALSPNVHYAGHFYNYNTTTNAADGFYSTANVLDSTNDGASTGTPSTSFASPAILVRAVWTWVAQPQTCDCPEGYTLLPDGVTCEKIIDYGPPQGAPLAACALTGSYNGNSYNYTRPFYSQNGARVYNDITQLGAPIVANISGTNMIVQSTSSVVPYTAVPSLPSNAWTDALNRRGVWTCKSTPSLNPDFPSNQWIGFANCLLVQGTESNPGPYLGQGKMHYFAISGKGAVKIIINGVKIVEINLGSTGAFPYEYTHIFPYFLFNGVNYFTIQVFNFPGTQSGALLAEIFTSNTTTPLAASTLINATTITALAPYRVFTTELSLGANSFFNAGDPNVPSSAAPACPPDFILTACTQDSKLTSQGGKITSDSVVSTSTGNCIQILTEPKPVCSVKLIPCCEGYDPVITELPVGITPNDNGGVVCIEDIYPEVGCYTIELTDELPNYTQPYTVGEIFIDCIKCSLSCIPCPEPSYFVLKDCCTNEPFTITTVGPGNVIVTNTFILAYSGDFANDNSPSNLQDLIITNFRGEDNSISYYGCWYISEIETPLSEEPVYPWETTMYDVETVPTCEECQCCNEVFLLTNCEDATDTIVVSGDLSEYVTGAINIEGCEDTSYIVSPSDDCAACTQEAVVIKSCPPEGGYAGYCKWDYPNLQDDIDTISIVYNGTTYTAPAPSITFFSTISVLNSFNIGVFGFGQEILNSIYVIGKGEYGPITFISQAQTITVNPTCTYNLLNDCKYGPFSLSSLGTGEITITVNGLTYVSGIITSTNIIVWLSSLNLGTFINIPNYATPGTFYLHAVGNNTYGTLILPGIEEPITLEPDCEQLVDPQTACTACLPPPPLVLPTGLIKRFVKPGYTTAACDPEYTEKVSCNFSDQYYQIMLSKRYGINVCCDPNLEYWVIKKALLEFEENNPKTIDLVPPVMCHCYEITSSVMDITFKYISCPGECTSVLVPVGETVYVCSQTYPHPVCCPGDNVTGYTITPCEDECTTNDDCVILPCRCGSVTSKNKSTVYVTYKACETEFCQKDEYVTVTMESDELIYLCTYPESVVLEYDPLQGPVLVSFDLESVCENNLDCTPCYCYTLFSDGQLASVTYINCDKETVVVPEFIGYLFICAKYGTVEVSADVEVTESIDICKDGTICQKPIECFCYKLQKISIELTTYSYINCAGQAVTATLNGVDYVCAKEGTVLVIDGGAIIAKGNSCTTTEQCQPVCLCYTVEPNVQVNNEEAPLVPATLTYITCEGSIISQPYNGETLNFCSQQGTVIITPPSIAIVTPGGPCETDQDCQPCMCYQIIFQAGGGTQGISYLPCGGLSPVTEEYTPISTDIIVYRCVNGDINTISGSPQIIPLETSCTNDLDCTPCLCYNLQITGSVTVQYIDCDGNTSVNEYVGAITPVARLCAKENSVTQIGGSGSFILTTQDVPCPGDQCDPACVCYGFYVNGTELCNVQWTNCITYGPTDNDYIPGALYTLCSRSVPTSACNIVFTAQRNCDLGCTPAECAQWEVYNGGEAPFILEYVNCDSQTVSYTVPIGETYTFCGLSSSIPVIPPFSGGVLNYLGICPP